MPEASDISTRGRRWRVAQESSLDWRSWDPDEHVVYCAESGDTHLINAFTAEVLHLLERSDLLFSDLVRDVAQSLGAEATAPFEKSIETLLVYLERIGLVESNLETG